MDMRQYVLDGSGFAQAFSACIACGHVFGYNPLRVPSTTAVTGKREPICRCCMDAINEKRKVAGLKPFEVAADAYDPIDESELP